MKEFNLKKYLAENKLLKEDKLPTKLSTWYTVPGGSVYKVVVTFDDGSTEKFRSEDEAEKKYDLSGVEREESEFDVSESLNEIKSGDIVTYKDEDHTVMRIEDDDLGVRVYIRPNEESYYLGKKDTFWVKPEDLKEDMNDPVLIKARASQMKRDKENAKQAHLDRKYGKNFMDKLNAELDLKAELEDLNHEREMIMIDMEEEAEPEGGEIADRYGERLNQIDQRIADIQEELDDLRMYESVNEEVTQKQIDDIEDSGNIDIAYKKAMKLLNSLKDKEDESVNEDKYLKNQDSYIRITEPRFIMDENNPNFLFVRIDYDTGPGVGMALGKETMAGQIRRLSSAEALRQADEIGRKLSKRFDLEDLEIVDMENGTVELFAVSDDFIDVDTRSELSMALLNEEFKVGDKVTYLGHPAVVTATQEYNGRNFVSVSYDKGNGKTKARNILATSGDVKAVNEMEGEIPSYLAKNVIFGKAVEDSVSFNDFQKRVYGILGPKYYKLTDQGALKNFYDSVRVTNPNLSELELDVTDSGNPETTGDEAIERESASPAFESKLTTIYKSIKK